MDGEDLREALGLVAGAEQLWSACADAIRPEVPEAAWKMCFQSARPVSLDDRHLVIALPSFLAKERIEARYLEPLRRVLDELGAGDHELVFEVKPDAARSEQLFGEDGEATEAASPTSAGNGAVLPPPPPRTTPAPPSINPKYTFDAFVTGTSNRFAHAAALSVAETPARSYNPLFIYGHAGLGKTHLLHAIAHYVHQNYPAFAVRYVTTEAFLNDYVEAIRTNTTPELRRRYREIDVLLIDDIQFIERKEGLQEELFHTFNSLHGAKRQIVISSDRPPDAIATLEDRLRSRFRWGLITDIQPPDLETRLAILRKKAERETTSAPDDVLEFIATHITDNIRELEGALIRVTAFASLNRETLSVEVATRVLADMLSDREPRPVTPQAMLEATAKMFGFTVDELKSKNRRRPLVTARQVGMYVFREMTDLSYPAIAREFGGRDHTTVIHAVEKISALMKERRQIYDQVTELMQVIRSGEV